MMKSINLKKLPQDEIKNLDIDLVSAYTVETLKFTIIPSGFDLDKINGEGMTLMHIYARKGFVSHIKYLIQQGAQSDIKDIYDKTPLDYLNLHSSNNHKRQKYRKIYKLLTGNNAPRAKLNQLTTD